LSKQSNKWSYQVSTTITGNTFQKVDDKNTLLQKVMSKKWFGRTSSSKNSDKLATDAVTMDENDANDSSERTQSDSLSISPLSPEIGLSSSFDNQNMSVMRRNDFIAERASLSQSNNTQTTIYQFKDINGLHIGNINICSVEPAPQRRSTTGETIPRTRSIDIMMRSTEPVNEKVMDVISTHLGKDWRFLFRNLGYSDGQIEETTIDFHVNGVKEIIYRLLLDYSRNHDDASLGHITKTMWKNGFKECVKILKTHWKNGELVTERRTDGGMKSSEATCAKSKCMD